MQPNSIPGTGPAISATMPTPTDNPLTQEQQECLDAFRAAKQSVIDGGKDPATMRRLWACVDSAMKFDDRSRPEFSEITSGLAQAVEAVVPSLDAEINADRYQLLPQLLNAFDQIFRDEREPLIELVTVRAWVTSLVQCSEVNAYWATVHSFDGVGPRLAAMIREAAVENWTSEGVLQSCATFVRDHGGIDHDLCAPLAGLLAQRYLERLSEALLGQANMRRWIFDGFVELTGQFPPVQQGPASTQRLRQFFLNTAKWLIDEIPRSRSEVNGLTHSASIALTNLLLHQDVPADHKREVAALLAGALVGENGTQRQPSPAENWMYAWPLIECLPHMPESLKAGVLADLIDNSPRHARWFEVIPREVRRLADSQNREKLQSALRPVLQREAPDGMKKLNAIAAQNLFTELILIDHEADPLALEALLTVVDTDPNFMSIMGPDDLDEIAVLTFHVDPDGKLFQPGTQRPAGNSNPKNPDMLEGGAPFFYPRWLADRRAILQEAAPAIAQGRVRDLISPIPLAARPVAQITENYSGLPVQPSDWRALLQALRDNPPAAPTTE
jgi:hypothetical protein